MPQALLTDQYTLTMGQFYWSKKMNDKVSFELFVRSLPRQRGYLIAAGLGTALWNLRQLHFTKEDIDFLASQGIYDPGYLKYLHNLDLSLDIDAVPEGTPVFPHEPILRVTGPRIEGTIVESLLLSIINHQTMIASKASRIVHAAGNRPVWDFSLRRLHGPEASLGVARAAYIAGCAGTATVEAGRILKIPTTGTMAHAMVMAYGEDQEKECFERILKYYPDNHALLVDTYNTDLGVGNAIRASEDSGVPLKAIRIDSNVERSAWRAKQILAASGFLDTKIICSNDLDEYAIASLKGEPIDAYGVGTMLGTSADAPHLGGVYKLVLQHDRTPRYIMKLTAGKQTDPGIHDVWRYPKLGDVITLVGEAPAANGEIKPESLLEPVMRNGRLLDHNLPSLHEARDYCKAMTMALPAPVRDIEEPAPWRVHRSEALWLLRASLGDKEAQSEIDRRQQHA